MSRLKESRVGQQLLFTDYANFCVIRGLCHLTLIAFAKSGHVNITGVRGFKQLSDILTLLSDVLAISRVKLRSTGVKAVSSTATGAVGHEVNLARLIYKYQAETNKRKLLLYLQYGHFPSLLIRRADRRGCVQLFCSGKFNIVGCNNEDDIEELWRAVTALTKMYSSVTSSCVATAVSS